jgi:hypothetical protein
MSLARRFFSKDLFLGLPQSTSVAKISKETYASAARSTKMPILKHSEK